MNTLSAPRLGFSLAMAAALSYVGCMFVMMTVPQDVTIRFFNSLMHGVDVTPIMRQQITAGFEQSSEQLPLRFVHTQAHPQLAKC